MTDGFSSKTFFVESFCGDKENYEPRFSFVSVRKAGDDSCLGKQKINAVDLGFIPAKKIILIPTFYDNRVNAKKLAGL